jgi:glycosyltransferase involved in cell wall biosynthesis
MTIAIIADPLDNQRAGVHVYVRELVRELADYEGPHTFLLIREKADPALDLRQIEVANIHAPVGYASLRLFVLIPRLLTKLEVDVVFEPAHFGPFNLPRNIRRVTMIHDLTPILFPEHHRFHSRLLQQLFLKRILRRTDLVLTNSLHTSSDVERVYPFTKGKVTTIHLGRDESFRPDAGQEFRQTYDLDHPYFLYVGTVEPRKNLLLLLEAYQAFRERHPSPTPLVIVGQKGWKSQSFYDAVAAHPYQENIRLTGFVEQRLLPQAYTSALALVYPSIYEGFGFPVLEALACGTNVVCPANSSLPEVGGELAYYYPTHDAAALTNRLLEVAQGGPEVDQRAAAGPAWAADFSWRTYAANFVRAVVGG